MKKSLVIFLIPLLIFFSCSKNDCPEVTTTAPAAEVTALKTYLDSHSIVAIEDPRGFFYNITVDGSGDHPTTCSGVTVDYAGKLTNGIPFDNGTSVSFSLSKLIIGWQEGIPLIGIGGSITLYLPPSLGYGSNANGDIPANSNLIFDITLKGIY